jgi:hypothetical protein
MKVGLLKITTDSYREKYQIEYIIRHQPLEFHSLRKTWGYHQRVTFGADLPTLMTCFNHSTQRQTLKYLCVQPGEVKAIYKNEI